MKNILIIMSILILFIGSVYAAGTILIAGDGATNAIIFGAGSDDKIYHDGTNLVLAPASGVDLIGSSNHCVIKVDADGTCDAGTALVVDNSIAMCAVCASN